MRWISQLGQERKYCNGLDCNQQLWSRRLQTSAKGKEIYFHPLWADKRGLAGDNERGLLHVTSHSAIFPVFQSRVISGVMTASTLHSGQAGGQNSWETKFHKRVRQSGQMIGLHGHDHESLFGTLGSLIGPLEAPQNDQKPLKMAISGTFKHPSQT